MVSTERFRSVLIKRQLVTSNQLDEVRRRFVADDEPDPRSLAQQLVAAGIVNRWQLAELSKGRRIFQYGNYRLLGNLGGKEHVFRAMHTRIGYLVALKLLPDALVQDEKKLFRFQREVQLVAKLDHANIVQGYDADADGDRHYLVMEFVEGKNLQQWCEEESQLPIGWVCECIRQAADALQYAHTLGIVHRDIKPSHLMVNASDTLTRPHVKLLDLGVARVMEAESMNRPTKSHETLGSYDYIAPEQAENSRSADTRSDIFSLGCTLYRALAGRSPFPGRTRFEKVLARSRSGALPIRSFRREIPGPLEAVISRMLARNPDDRYQTPQEVADALLGWRL